MPCFEDIPRAGRATLYHEFRASLFGGAYMAVALLASMIARKALHATELEVAILSSARLGCMLLAIYWGHVAAHRRKMPFVFWPTLIGRGLLVAGVFVTKSPLFVILMTLSYAGAAISIPAHTAILKQNYPDSHRARILGAARGSGMVVTVAAAYLAGKLLDYNDEFYRLILPIAGVLGVVGALMFRRIKVQGEKDIVSVETPRFSLAGTLGILVKDRKFGLFTICFFVFGFANIMLRPLVVLLPCDELKVSYGSCAKALAVVPQLFMVVGLYVWGRFVDATNPMTARSFFNMTVSFATLLLFFARSMTPVYLSVAISGLALGGSSLTWFIAVTYFAKRDEVARYMGVHTAFTGLRGLLAPFAGIGLMHLMGLRNVFLLSAAVQIVVAAVLCVMGQIDRMAVRNRTEDALHGRTT